MSACQEPQPKPDKHLENVPVEKTETEVQKLQDTNINRENFIKEDAFNRVFTGCFETGKITLEKRCKKDIDSFLKSTPLSKKRNILIEVHTDVGSSNESNLIISKKRAYKVADSLYYKEYKYSKVYYKGYGEAKPLYNLRSPEADRANRRVVIRLRDKNEKVKVNEYSLYKRTKELPVKKTSVKKPKKIKKIEAVDIKKYTGKADTGWIYFGKKELAKKFDISCALDKPRDVRNKSIKGYSKEKFIAGLYKKVIKAKVDKERLILAPVSVFDNGYIAKETPNILLTRKNDSKVVLTTTVNTYHGEQGILYRVFVNKKNSPKNSLQCMDLVLSYQNGEVKYGVAYFLEKGEVVSKKLTDF